MGRRGGGKTRWWEDALGDTKSRGAEVGLCLFWWLLREPRGPGPCTRTIACAQQRVKTSSFPRTQQPPLPSPFTATITKCRNHHQMSQPSPHLPSLSTRPLGGSVHLSEPLLLDDPLLGRALRAIQDTVPIAWIVPVFSSYPQFCPTAAVAQSSKEYSPSMPLTFPPMLTSF
jgi:hypothetical protein